MNSTRNVITRKLTPHCENMGTTIKTVGIILLILAILLIIFLIISVVYNQYSANGGADDGGAATRAVDESTVSNILQIICIILGVAVAGIGIWHTIIANSFVKCVNEGGANTM